MLSAESPLAGYWCNCSPQEFVHWRNGPYLPFKGWSHPLQLGQPSIRALARAHRWNPMLEAQRCHSITEIAEAEKIDRSFVSRLLDLTLLAPDIQEAILEGRRRRGCSWRS
jgi:hypothetical protein